jgi:hypothetical protein
LQFARFDVLVTRRLSLKDLDSKALTALRMGGSCDIPVPTWWLDRLDAGIRNRRVRSVSVSIPCISGPKASVNATLTFGGVTSSPIARIHLASGVSDYGWDMGLRAESYVPFENISLDADATWKLQLSPYTAVDKSSIADVVLQLEYTANRGNGSNSSAPTSWPIRVDLERDEPRAWQALTRTVAHKASFGATDFLPAALLELTRPSAAVRITSDGTKVIAGIVGKANGQNIELTWDGTTAIDWPAIRTIYADWDMTAPPPNP